MSTHSTDPPASREVTETYRRAGFDGSLRRGTRPAVLVVDLQRGFTDPACPLGSEMDEVVLANARLLEVARAAGVPVVFTAIAFSDAPADGGVWLQKVPTLAQLKVGSPWHEIDPRLAPRAEELVITKRFASAFFGTHLATALAALGVDTLILTGATTSGCVRASAVDAMQHGYPTLVPRECVADRAEGPHAANLFDMGAKYVDVVSVEEVVSYLLSRPGHGRPGPRPGSAAPRWRAGGPSAQPGRANA